MDDSTLVLLILAIAALLFATDRVRMDFVSILVVLAFSISGILTPKEALSGFGEPVVILVAGLMVIGEALDRTGIARGVGNLVVRFGGSSRPRVVALLMGSAALLSSFMSSTAVVAIFLPIVSRISKQTKISASRLLLPMSFGAMIGGTLTLIATMPNLVISDALVANGLAPLGFFSFSPIGFAILLGSLLFVVLIGDRVLSRVKTDDASVDHRSISQMLTDFQLPAILDAYAIEPNSQLVDCTLAQVDLQRRYAVRVLAIYPSDGRARLLDAIEPNPQTMLHASDVLVLAGESEAIEALAQQPGLHRVQRSSAQLSRTFEERGVGLIMVHPSSRHVGRTVREVGLRSKHGLHVIGLQRAKQRISDFSTTPLQVADVLLVAGSWKRIAAVSNDRHDFVLLELPAEHELARPAFRKAPLALAAVAFMIVASTANLVPIPIAVLLSAVFVVLTGCVRANEAYRSISWSSLVLLAGMLPVAIAMEKTGVTQQLVAQLSSVVSAASPNLMMAVLFSIAAVLSLVLSNTATAVVLAPIAIQMANTYSASPLPFAISVLLGASCAFASPVASPVVTLVVEPGHYSIREFAKLGLPLMVLALLINWLLTPIIFPLYP